MTPYHKVIVYYFSGTGNSRNVAFWLSQVASEMKIEPEVVNIVQTDRLNIIPPPTGALLVFVSPVHGFNYPPVMLHYIRRFPKGNNAVLLMNTRAGMLIGKWITPGLSGVTFFLSGAILRFKGYHIKAMCPVNLPSNWISVHPGLNNPTIKYLHRKNKEIVVAFARKTLGGKSDFRALYEIAQDLLISPVALGYYFIGRFFLAKTYYASGDCIHCDLCIKRCPVKAIVKVDGRPFWTFRCESCMKCMSNCPVKAIETAHGSIVALTLLFSMFLWVPFEYYFSRYVFNLSNEMVSVVVQSAVLVVLLALWYRIIHYLLRFRLFERLIVYTSLTKYKFWGRRYKALNENDVY